MKKMSLFMIALLLCLVVGCSAKQEIPTDHMRTGNYVYQYHEGMCQLVLNVYEDGTYKIYDNSHLKYQGTITNVEEGAFALSDGEDKVYLILKDDVYVGYLEKADYPTKVEFQYQSSTNTEFKE